MNQMHELLQKLADRRLTLGTVESMTGGLFAAAATEIPGASHVYKGGIVTYSNKVKEELVGVSHASIESHGVVSDRVAREMACFGRNKLGVDICLSVTGNAGPTAEPGDAPVGKVHFALATKKAVWAFEYQFEGERSSIRRQAVMMMVQFALSHLQKITEMTPTNAAASPQGKQKLLSASEINDFMKEINKIV